MLKARGDDAAASGEIDPALLTPRDEILKLFRGLEAVANHLNIRLPG
jgi:hypothetical protein